MEKTRSEKKDQLIVPKIFRRNSNAHLPAYLRGPKKRPDGKWKFVNNYFSFGTRNIVSNQFLAETTKRRKFKGYQREARRYNKKAA
jgi:molybdate-binding protein